jgi:hypothetical protein
MSSKNPFIEIQKKLKSLAKAKAKIGVPDSKTDESGARIATYARIHEYGGTINHPGGTKYIIKDGQAKFVPSSFSGEVEGITKPHKIDIPERPAFRLGIAEYNQNLMPKVIEKNLGAYLSGQIRRKAIFDQVGALAVGEVRKKMGSSELKPNKPATIRRKKSSAPLIGQTGNLRQSVTYVYEYS